MYNRKEVKKSSRHLPPRGISSIDWQFLKWRRSLLRLPLQLFQLICITPRPSFPFSLSDSFGFLYIMSDLFVQAISFPLSLRKISTETEIKKLFQETFLASLSPMSSSRFSSDVSFFLFHYHFIFH